MDIDDQLAALAAGELDDETARALRERVAADPALARTLRRIERLDRALRGWEAPAMSAEAAGALDAAVDEALAALDDGPIVPRSESTDGGVTSLDAARERRARRRSLPEWVAPAAVAAALFGVVGVSVLQGFPSAQDGPTIMADDSGEDAADESFDATMAERSERGPQRVDGLAISEGDLEFVAALAQPQGTALSSGSAPTDATDDDGPMDPEADEADDTEEADADTDAASGDGAAESAPLDEAVRFTQREEPCVASAVERTSGPFPLVVLVGSGTYGDVEATFVVVTLDAEDPDGPSAVYAFAAGTCDLLDSDIVD